MWNCPVLCGHNNLQVELPSVGMVSPVVLISSIKLKDMNLEMPTGQVSNSDKISERPKN